jgi:hypothetical protein
MAFVEQPTVGISATGQVVAFLPSVVAVPVASLTNSQRTDIPLDPGVQEKCNHIAAEIVFATIQFFNIAQLQSPSQHSVRLKNTTHGFDESRPTSKANLYCDLPSVVNDLTADLISADRENRISASFIKYNQEMLECIIARTAIFVDGQPCDQQMAIIEQADKFLGVMIRALGDLCQPQHASLQTGFYAKNGSDTPVDMEGEMVAASESASPDLRALPNWGQMR